MILLLLLQMTGTVADTLPDGLYQRMLYVQQEGAHFAEHHIVPRLPVDFVMDEGASDPLVRAYIEKVDGRFKVHFLEWWLMEAKTRAELIETIAHELCHARDDEPVINVWGKISQKERDRRHTRNASCRFLAIADHNHDEGAMP